MAGDDDYVYSSEPDTSDSEKKRITKKRKVVESNDSDDDDSDSSSAASSHANGRAVGEVPKVTQDDKPLSDDDDDVFSDESKSQGDDDEEEIEELEDASGSEVDDEEDLNLDYILNDEEDVEPAVEVSVRRVRRPTIPLVAVFEDLEDATEEEKTNYELLSQYAVEKECAENIAIERHFSQLELELGGKPIERKIRLQSPFLAGENGFVAKEFKTFDDPSGLRGSLLSGTSLNQHVQLIDKNIQEGIAGGVQSLKLKVEMNVDSFRFFHGCLAVHARLLDSYGGKLANLRSRQSRLGRERISLRVGVNGLFPKVQGRNLKNIPLDRFPSSLLIPSIQVQNMSVEISVVFMHREYLSTNYMTNRERGVLNICLNVSKIHYLEFIGDDLNCGDVISKADFQKYIQVLGNFVEKTKEDDTKYDKKPLPGGCLTMFLICFERVLKHLADLHLEGGGTENQMRLIEFDEPCYHGFHDESYSDDYAFNRHELIGEAHLMKNHCLFVSLIKNVKQAHTVDEGVLKKKKFLVEHPYPSREEGDSFLNSSGETVIRYKHLTPHINEVYKVVMSDFTCNFDWSTSTEGKGIIDVGLDFWSMKAGEWLVCSMEDLRHDMKQNYSRLYRLPDEYLSVLDVGSTKLIVEKYHLENDLDENFIRENVNAQMHTIDVKSIPRSVRALMGEGKRESFSKHGLLGSTMYGGATTGRMSCLLTRCSVDHNIDPHLDFERYDTEHANIHAEERILKPYSVKPLWDGDMMGIVAYSNKLKTAQMLSSVVEPEKYDKLQLYVWKVLEGLSGEEEKKRKELESHVQKLMGKVVKGLRAFLLEINKESFDVRLETFQNANPVQEFVSTEVMKCAIRNKPSVLERKAIKKEIKKGSVLFNDFSDLKYGEILHIGHITSVHEIAVLVDRTLKVLERTFCGEIEYKRIAFLDVEVRLSIMAHFEHGLIFLGLTELRKTKVWKQLSKNVPFGHVLNYPLELTKKASEAVKSATGVEFVLDRRVLPLNSQVPSITGGCFFLRDDVNYVSWDYMKGSSRDFSGLSPILDWREYHDYVFNGPAKFSDLRSTFLGSVDCLYSCAEALGFMLSLFYYYEQFGNYCSSMERVDDDEGTTDISDEVMLVEIIEAKGGDYPVEESFNEFMDLVKHRELSHIFLVTQLQMNGNRNGWYGLDAFNQIQMLRKVWRLIFLLYAEYMLYKKLDGKGSGFGSRLGIKNFPMTKEDLLRLVQDTDDLELKTEFVKTSVNKRKRRGGKGAVSTVGKNSLINLCLC